MRSKFSIPFTLLTTALVILALAGSRPAWAQDANPQATLGTAFTYQGQLLQSGQPYSGSCDFLFSLWDTAWDGTQVGDTQAVDNLLVQNGLFTASLDFGATPFQGEARWLATSARCPAGSGDYVDLLPRQALTPAPYALNARSVAWEDVTGMPTGFSDGMDDNTTYSAGAGLAISGTQFTVTGAPWSGLNGVPAGFSDGIDNDTQYTAGFGLALTGTQLTVTGAPWNGLSGVPAGFSDGIDNDTTYTAGTGLSLAGGQISLGTGYRLPQSCGNGQLPEWNGSAWACANDDNNTYTAGDGLALNGTQFSAQGTAYQNVVIVAKSGGDFTTIQAALDSISDATDTNRYLVWVAPGVYTERITLKPYVSVQGAGIEATRLTFSGSAAANTATVIGANNAEIRDLTIESHIASETETYAIGMYNYLASPRVENVRIVVNGTGPASHVATGILSNLAAPSVTRSTITVSGGTSSNTGISTTNANAVYSDLTITVSGPTSRGIYNTQSSVTLRNVSVDGGLYGIWNTLSSGSYTTLVYNSQVTGSTNTVYTSSTSITVRIGASSLSGGPTVGGTMTCAGVYDENFAFSASTCP